MANQWSKAALAENLKRLIERTGKTQIEVAEAVGVSAPTFSDWVNAKKYPRIDKIQKLADYFGILKTELIDEQELETPTPQGEREQEFIKCFRGLSEDDQILVLRMMKALLENK